MSSACSLCRLSHVVGSDSGPPGAGVVRCVPFLVSLSRDATDELSDQQKCILVAAGVTDDRRRVDRSNKWRLEIPQLEQASDPGKPLKEIQYSCSARHASRLV